jgi:FkbH-like protein
MIFVDDSPSECALVRQECPGCEVIALPDKPYLLPALPASFPGVENVRLTHEDRRKAELYRAQAARREHEEEYSNLDEYLRSLQIEVSIDPASSFSIPRIAQLTQKTNQMNMTTRRYTEAQVHAMVQDPAWAVFSVASRDRFGDEGITGVFILRFDADTCVIDTFLLSCRVIGRGIERLMLAFVADYARARGVRWIEAEFVRTQKNQPASGFYESNGFIQAGETLFRSELAATAFACPDHIRLSAPSGVAAG